MKAKASVNKAALSQKIEKTIKKQLMAKVSHEYAKKVRGLISSIAQAYFIGMLQGCKALTRDSTVAAVSYPDNGQRRKRNIGGKVVSSRVKKTRKYVEETIRHTEKLEYKAGTAALSQKRLGESGIVVVRPDSETVSLKVKWEYLSHDYAKRRPESEVFFRKRLDQMSGSTGAALIALIDQAIGQSNTSAKFNKGAPKLTPHSNGNMHIEFTINYPKLPEEIDFLREALVNRKANVEIHNLAKRYGILYAERMRPMYRPYAAAMGKSMSIAIRNSLKQ